FARWRRRSWRGGETTVTLRGLLTVLMFAIPCLAAGAPAANAERPMLLAQAKDDTQSDPDADKPPDLADNNTCLGCHSTHAFASPRAAGTPRELFVPAEEFKKSVHGKAQLQCINCHSKITEIPHKSIAKTIGEWRTNVPQLCGTCHPAQLSQYLT